MQEENKKIYLELLKTVDREGIDELIDYLLNTDFFEAPASSKYHCCYVGGLVQHSLNVYKLLLKEVTMGEVITKTKSDTLKIVALLHDVCKINFYKESTKNVKNEKDEWIQVPFYTYDEKLPLGHGEKSVILIQKYINLTDEEILAIRWHMGAYVPKEEYQSLGQAYKKCNLALALHIADLKATYILEND